MTTRKSREIAWPNFGACPHCERKRVLWPTGRLWICRECYRERLGAEPDA